MKLKCGDQYFVRLDEICEHHIKCIIKMIYGRTIEISPMSCSFKITMTKKEFKERSFKT